MRRKKYIGYIIAGLCAGAVNGLFGAGGGMVLVPLLTLLTGIDENEIFPASVAIILPICIVSLSLTIHDNVSQWSYIFPCLTGSILGGIAAGIIGKKLSTQWMHKLLGILIIWGGLQYL